MLRVLFALVLWSSLSFAQMINNSTSDRPNMFIGTWYFGDGLILKQPNGWGYGKMKAGPNIDSFLTVLPESGGYGAMLYIRPISDEECEDLLAKFGEGFQIANPIPPCGYELENEGSFSKYLLINGYEVCLEFSPPEINDFYRNRWEELITIVREPKKEFENVLPKKVAEGYLFEQEGLLFSTATAKAFRNFNGTTQHKLEYSDLMTSGFFFQERSEKDPNNKKTYAEHLKSMVRNMKKLYELDCVSERTQYDLENNVALTVGYPIASYLTTKTII